MSDPADEQRHASDTLSDRRRAGRAEFRNPHLLALLRRTGSQFSSDSSAALDGGGRDRAIEAEAPDREQNDLGPAFGIAISVVISVIIWLAFAVAAMAIAAL